MTKDTSPQAPIAARQPTKRIFHEDIELCDDYDWLRAHNWQEVLKNPQALDKNIRQYLEAENQYLDAFMQDSQNFTKEIFCEMKARIREEDSSIPEKDGDFYYGYSYKKGSEHADFYRASSEMGQQHIYLSGDREAANKAYFKMGSICHSPDHKKFIFSFDDKGSEFYQYHIREFGEIAQEPSPARSEDSCYSSDSAHSSYKEVINNAAPGAVWDSHSHGFFYTKLNENHRPHQIFYHSLGSDPQSDQLIYQENDPGFFMSLRPSKLRDVIFIEIHDHETSEIWLIDATKDFRSEPPQAHLVKKREKYVDYSLIEGGDIFYILTNQGGAKDFKIMQAPKHAPYEENWREVIPHQEGRIILSIDSYEKALIWLERENALAQLKIMKRQNGEIHNIAFQEPAYCLGLRGAREYHSEVIRFTYSSLTTPEKLFAYNMISKERKLLKTQIIPSGHKETDYITERIYAPGHDGAVIPISLYYHKGTKLDGSAPCLLYGYGSYGYCVPAQFNSPSLSLVNRGFIYAIAHIRGGKDKGFAWYEYGKYQYKTNSFHDFISCARFLASQNYSSKDKITAFGGSAGGMLMGAIANMAPQDFFAIIALVPFVDVLNTMLDDTLPLTPPEWPEWGNPITSREDFQLIAGYSPYDNIKNQPYPHILAMAGLTDPRVTYWEAAKWVAKLRGHNKGDKQIFLKTNMESGHAGASGRFAKLEETAFIYSYILKLYQKTRP